MKLADYVIDRLAEAGIKDVFFVYGAANGDLCDAFTRTDKIRYVAVMHEQAGGFAAEGYAKVHGLAAAMATSGPGGQNFVTPIANCFYDSVPCIFITGQIKSRFLRPNKEIRQVGFQETDIVSIVDPITKYAIMVDDPISIKYHIDRALYEATSGRPGPVLLDLPIDIQQAEIDPDKLIGFSEPKQDFRTNETFDQIKKVANDILNGCARPCFLIGGGTKDVDVLNRLLDIVKIPAFPTWNALHIVCDDNPYFGGRIGTYGGKGRNFGIQNSDLIIGVGTRLSGRITGGNPSSFGREAKRYVVDVDKPALQPHLQQLPFHENIYCDSTFFLDQLADILEYVSIPDFSGWTKKVMDWKEKYDPVKQEYFDQYKPLNQYAFMRKLSQLCGPNDIIVGDCGGNIVTMAHAFETKTGQTWITNNGNSPMGFSFAGGIGAAIASRHKNTQGNVICIIGDGGMNMNIQELQTLLNYDIPLKVFIINNQIYGITKAYQEVNFGGRSEACGPKGYSPPDFIKIAEAYGLTTINIHRNTPDSWHDIEREIISVLNHNDPIICNIDVKEEHIYEPKIVGWSTSIEDMYPYLPEEEMNKNMIIKQSTHERVYPDVKGQ